MRMQRPIHRLLGIAFVLSLCATGANAGLGDMLKEMVKAIKGEPKARPAATAAETGAIKSRMSPPVTAESLAKFKAAMQIEKTERERAVKFLASLKTQEEYSKCQMEVMRSPEGMKIAGRMSAMDDKTTPEEFQKVMAQVGADMQKLTEEKCGPDPGAGRSRGGEMMREALAKGSDAFVGDDNTYSIWKEWVLEFCKYIEKIKQDPDAKAKLAKIRDEGLRIPGTGQGIYYVYTASEATLLLEQCEELVALIEATS